MNYSNPAEVICQQQPNGIFCDDWGLGEHRNLKTSAETRPGDDGMRSALEIEPTTCAADDTMRTIRSSSGRSRACRVWAYVLIAGIAFSTTTVLAAIVEVKRKITNVAPPDAEQMANERANAERYRARISKYATREWKEEVYVCDGHNPAGLTGAFEKKYLNRVKGAIEAVSAEGKSCVIEMQTRGEYDFCNRTAENHMLCVGGTLNTDYVANDGAIGQDCWSWERLSQYMEGEIQMSELEAFCRAFCRRRETAGPGCQEDGANAERYGKYPHA
eukprot:scaffold2103_cov185-Amphora_coffeaeformis.AAC.2